MTQLRTIFDVACPGCGCVCDDLTVTVQAGQVTAIGVDCAKGQGWFSKHTAASPPVARWHGNVVPLNDAIHKAAAILGPARSPLIYGLSHSSTEGQRAAVALADRLGAVIDTTASTGHGASIVALQQVGESTCTLGEVRNRADLVIYWGSDPVETHPRHIERYCSAGSGTFIRSRGDRHIVVVDAQRTQTALAADEFIALPREVDFEAFWQLRMLVQGKSFANPNPVWQALSHRLRTCKFGIIFFGVDVARGPLAHRTIEMLLQLVTDLNQHTRFYARRMRRSGDVAGADSVLAWQTGYPFGVNFASGFPRSNPGETTGPEILARGEADVALLLGSEAVLDFSPAALAHLKTIPVIAIDSPGDVCPVPAQVRITTAVHGLHVGGTAYRMDEVPIPLKGLLESAYPTDADVISAIASQLLP